MRRHSGPAIGSLPIEVLVQIFVFYRDYQRPTMLGMSPSWQDLMLVCRFWRELIISTPLLWQRSHWCTRASLESLALALMRSRQVPLELFFYNLDMAEKAIPMLLPHVSRLRALHLPPFDENIRRTSTRSHPRNISCQWFLPLLTSGTPLRLLKELVIPRKAQRLEHTVQRVPMDITESSLPSLRILRITCASFAWDVRAVSRLTCLDLRGCVHDGPRMSSDGFLDVLESCHALEELRLLNHFVSSTLLPNPTGRTADREVEMPKLRKLFLADESGVISGFLSSLKLRKNISISVCGSTMLNPRATHGAFQALLPRPFHLKRLFPTAAPLRCKIDTQSDGKAQIHIRFGRARNPADIQADDFEEDPFDANASNTTVAGLTLQLETHSPAFGDWQPYLGVAIKDFNTLFCGSQRDFPVKALDIQGDLTDRGVLSYSDWEALLWRLPSLTRLQVSSAGSSTSLIPALETISRRMDLICPKLKILSICDAECRVTRDSAYRLIGRIRRQRAWESPFDTILRRLSFQYDEDNDDTDLEENWELSEEERKLKRLRCITVKSCYPMEILESRDRDLDNELSDSDSDRGLFEESRQWVDREEYVLPIYDQRAAYHDELGLRRIMMQQY
ncbi:uncharacterized protein TRAVEDRAFT_24065 [Trametes versicolor FP-101664 SS1]|uniref:uncharacterized protein n=1 Tax=Trametes versicolor (strain FP-101664) TaxID=717944 RepID=UPI0004621618|nr:uncharacterized protein TRAVEDRAFT_24065 [Trametes versicolor FP-101664 SS1]EIW52571.1 hypothetical protein TRAVEDRAFT_24065 [Trametes versicolor FP-101664 SS1]